MEESPKTVRVKRMVVPEKKPEAGRPDMKQVKMVSDNLDVRYTETVQIDTHLYKLVEAPVIKYIGKEKESSVHPNTSPNDFLDMGHAHIFRTTDSDGRKHIRTVPIAGHHHLLELSQPSDPKEAPTILSMSGPMRLVMKVVNGRKVQVDEPVNHFDDHTHDVLYIKSEKIQARSTNVEAAKFMAQDAAKIPAVGGVSELSGR